MNDFFILLVFSIILNLVFLVLLRNYQKKNKELSKLSTVDPVTKINNQYKLRMILEEQIFISRRYNRNLSIVHFSIDDFDNLVSKQSKSTINFILKEMVTLFSKQIRLSDIIGRWNHKEFMVILPETSMIHAVMLTERLRQKLEIHQFEDVDVLTASFGVTIMNEKDEVQTFVSRAENALLKAQKAGTNKIEVI